MPRRSPADAHLGASPTDAPNALAVVDHSTQPILAVPTHASLERSPAAVYLARLAPSSRRVMRSTLDSIVRLLDVGDDVDALIFNWTVLRYEHTSAIRALLVSRQLAPSTANRHLAALRGVLRECWRLGYVGVEDYQRAVDLEPVRGSRLPRGRALEAGEIDRLFQACATDRPATSATRDAALLAVLYGAGLRRAEAIALDLVDYDSRAGTLKVRGKGNKERLAHVGAGGRAALDDWIDIRGSASGPLFWPVHRSGRIGPPRRLSAQSVLYLAQRRADDGGVAKFSPHDLRRSFVSDLLDRGVDLSTAQQLAGHAQVQTTARYDRRGEEAKSKAARQLHVPYRRQRV